MKEGKGYIVVSREELERLKCEGWTFDTRESSLFGEKGEGMSDIERLTEELLAAIEERNRLVEENERMIFVIVDQNVRERLLRDAEARRN